MIIENLKLTNVGRHQALDFSCASPVVGLLGINGVGKSTLFEMLKYAFTGEVEDKLDSYVRYGEGNASVEATFVKNGQRGTIFRQFGKTTKRTLTWNGQEKKSAKEVDATMAEIFAADKQAIANAVFVRQGMLENILFSGESDRRSMFIKLVNMAFCAKRANTILGKIRKLEATITDLDPMIQALTIQRDTAASQVATSQAEVEALKDYSVEIAFCEAFAVNEDRLKRVVATIGQMDNEITAHELERDRLFQVIGVDSEAGAIAKAKNLTDRMRLAISAVNTFDSVSAELTHYDRVSREIKDITDRLNGTLAEIKTLNPSGKTKEQIEQDFTVSSAQAVLYPWQRKTQETLLRWENYKAQSEADLKSRVAPVKTLADIAPMRLAVATQRGRADMIKAMLETQQRLAKCMGDQVNNPTATCPDCGLVLADPAQLLPSRLDCWTKDLEAMRLEIASQDNQINEADAALNDHNAFVSQKKGAIKNADDEIAKIKKQLADNQPSLPEEEAKSICATATSQREKLPGLEKLSKQQAKDLQDKLKERAGYLIAQSNLANRANFTPEIGQNLRKVSQEASNASEDYQEPYGNLQQSCRAIHGCRERRASLVLQKNELERIMDEPMLTSVVALAVQFEGNMEAIKVELKNRNDVRQQALGRQDQAKANYERLNNEYQDLKRRAAADIEKRKLIEELHTLRSILEDDGLPMAVVRYHFEKLAALTQEALAQLDANFAIMVDEDQELGFKFIRLDEPVQYEMPMNKLSGGQRVRLCVAFLMAVQRRLVREVGLLVLDEPSVHIDPAGVESLAELLTSLQGQLKNTEMQVWVADHHPMLENCFSTKLLLK